MKKCKLTLLFIIIALAGFGADNQTQIDSANACYIKGKFEDAIRIYEKVLASGDVSPYLYFNLGNAYYRSNKLTMAILNYERAQILAPEDEDINFNLELTRKHAVDKITPLPDPPFSSCLNRNISSFSSDTWAVTSLVCFTLFLVLLALYFFMRILLIRKISFWTSILVLLISGFTFWFSWDQKLEVTNRSSAIVQSDVVNVKSSPDEAGTEIFILHEGTKVAVRDSIGEWREIRMADGNSGWVKASEIITI
jgi:tetratricopeptide (TPR) repeat protein